MKNLKYGMVGDDPGAMIGEAHREAIALDCSAELVAGCFSMSPEKTAALGRELGIAQDRCYTNYLEMAHKKTTTAETGRANSASDVTTA